MGNLASFPFSQWYLFKPHHSLLSTVASEQALKNSQSISGNKDMTLYEIVEFIIHATKQLAFKAERVYG